MMRTGISSMLLGAFLLTGVLTGCKQGDGERCQIDDDCGPDLYCLLSSSREAGGYCRSTNPTPPPASITPDLSSTAPPADMLSPPVDMTPPPDLL